MEAIDHIGHVLENLDEEFRPPIFDQLAEMVERFGYELVERDPGPAISPEEYIGAWEYERRGNWAPGSELESWAKMAGIMLHDEKFGLQ